ncbi:type II secretion system secretin GspD [Desulfobaculum bizertense]|uniref:type II secretion system secretin GspD n=1 Tax=Desulfobaculum bizertense TaxID=376490 RepID=UPI0013566193|nr:type II secretion system secretin GspD [Desulfobaculum bizertense]
MTEHRPFSVTGAVRVRLFLRHAVESLWRIVGCFALCLALWAWAVPCPQACAARLAQEGTPQRVRMDFDNADIRLLIKVMSRLTGTNYVVDQRVKGKVTVFSPHELNAADACNVFESVLQGHGFSVVREGSVSRIVPSAEARSMNMQPLQTGKGAGKHSGIVTRIIPLKRASAPELRKNLKALVSRIGIITASSSGNLLVITDFAPNVERIREIVAQADRENVPRSVQVFQLRYASAEELAQSIERLLPRDAAQGKKAQVQAQSVMGESRTNRLLFLGSAEELRLVTELVRMLDTAAPLGCSDVHTVYLENADATGAAKVLQALVDAQEHETQGARDSHTLSQRKISVVADPATNSLLVAARPDAFRNLRQTIAQLDIPRRQVYVEALIMEVSADQGISFGVKWGLGDQFDIDGTPGLIYSGSNPGGPPGVVNTEKKSFTMPGGLSAGLVFFPFKIGDELFNSVESLISASRVDSNFRILATPQLLTLDNQQARVDVVDTIPYVEKVTSGTENTDESQTIRYRDVGVKLEVTPQIGRKNLLRLKLHQEVSRLVNSTVSVGEGEPLLLAPTTKKRQVDTTVQVRNGQTIVLAGLISRDEGQDENKVPGLADVPGLGWLFKQRSNTRVDTNLLLFLTPRILDTVESARLLTREKRGLLEFDVLSGASDSIGVPHPLAMPWVTSHMRILR